MLLELDGSDDVVRKYTWGMDLAGVASGLRAGRLESAGGIGGLLAVHDADLEDDYVYLYDATGNVGQLVDLAAATVTAALVAKYEYDPYGAVVTQSGDYAAANPFRFSTKYWDDETGLGYWPARYYDPRTGRWMSRDPMGEEGGLNLYVNGMNSPTMVVDALGLAPDPAVLECRAYWRDGYLQPFLAIRNLRDAATQRIAQHREDIRTNWRAYEAGDITWEKYKATVDPILDALGDDLRLKEESAGELGESFETAAFAKWMVLTGCDCGNLRSATTAWRNRKVVGRAAAAYRAVLEIIGKPGKSATKILKMLRKLRAARKEGALDRLLRADFNSKINSCCMDSIGSQGTQVNSLWDVWINRPTIDTLCTEADEDYFHVDSCWPHEEEK
ncbi:MAG: RHS repeat-associated core domain-containing protein [Phycisphaerae bacterium]